MNEFAQTSLLTNISHYHIFSLNKNEITFKIKYPEICIEFLFHFLFQIFTDQKQRSVTIRKMSRCISIHIRREHILNTHFLL